MRAPSGRTPSSHAEPAAARTNGGERLPVTLSRLDGLSQSRRRRVIALGGEAAAHYEAGRHDEARRVLAPLVQRHPDVPELRELHGLALYRLGRWAAAISELAAFAELTGSVEQHHVVADCERALGHHARVDELWDELREVSPDGDVVTEGRIVAAGSLADRGELGTAIALLRRGPVRPRRVKPSTLRLWYALADLLSRDGDVPGAREHLERIVGHDARFGDARERLSEMS